MKREKKRIKIGKGEYISVRQVRKIAADLEKQGLEITKENILNRHYRLQTAHPLLRIFFGGTGLFLIAGALYYKVDWGLILACLFTGGVLIVLAWRGRKKEITGMVQISKRPQDAMDSLPVELTKTLLELVFEIITNLDI